MGTKNENQGAQEATLARLLAYFRAHNEAIAEILGTGAIAIVPFELNEEGKAHTRSLGWNGTAIAWAMPRKVREAMIAGCKKAGDRVTPKWLQATEKTRIFVAAHAGGTLLVNLTPRGFELEPGQADTAWMS